ncbi:MAG: hypothetical protein R3B47_09045 [Bacteroidia bacterium]
MRKSLLNLLPAFLLFLAINGCNTSSHDVQMVTLDDYAVPRIQIRPSASLYGLAQEIRHQLFFRHGPKVSFARIRALRSGNFRQGGKGLRIGLFDADQDGEFNDTGVDYIIVAPYASDTMPVFDCAAAIIQPGTPFFVQVDRGLYRIDSIAPWKCLVAAAR